MIYTITTNTVIPIKVKRDFMSRPEPIAVIDSVAISEFLVQNSDFTFELEVVNALHEKGISYIEHSGTYIDPVEKKPREFDIRADIYPMGHKCIRLAIECKNVRPESPVIIECVPRGIKESEHQVVMFAGNANSLCGKVHACESFYKVEKPVGKSWKQYGKHKDIKEKDPDIYVKWAQALNSAHDLLSTCHEIYNRNGANELWVAVFPIVVIPDGRLWAVEYDSNGKLSASPKPAERLSFFINREYKTTITHPEVQLNFRISHLEVMTISGLKAAVDMYKDADTDIFHRKTSW